MMPITTNLDPFLEASNQSELNPKNVAYAPIHQFIMDYLRDSQAKTDQNDLFARLKFYLENLEFDLSLTDKHGRTVLHMLLEFADMHFAVSIAEIFIEHGADVNQVNARTGKTPLEAAIRDLPYAEELASYFLERTQLTDELKQKFSEMVNDARNLFSCAGNEADIINFIYDNKLTDYKPKSQPKLKMLKEGPFSRGCWIRTLQSPEKELENLKKRAKLSPSQVKKLDREQNWALQYGSACFVKSGVPASIFDNLGAPGFIIELPTKAKIDYWYDGSCGEHLTRESCFKEAFSHGDDINGQHWNIGHTNIVENLESLQKKNYKKYISTKADKYGVIGEKHVKLVWNEGLLSYKCEHIVGILVGKSAKQALNLKKLFKLSEDTPFYSYNDDSTVKKWSIKKLADKASLEDQLESSSADSGSDDPFGFGLIANPSNLANGSYNTSKLSDTHGLFTSTTSTSSHTTSSSEEDDSEDDSDYSFSTYTA